MTYILPSITNSVRDPVWICNAPGIPDEGLFYVRWWGDGSVHPVEYTFDSRAEALKKMDTFYRLAPYVRIEMLEAKEWGTKTRSRI